MYEGGAAGDRARFLRRRAGGHAPPGDGRSGMDEAPSGNGRTSVWDDEVADGPAPVPGAWIAKSESGAGVGRAELQSQTGGQHPGSARPAGGTWALLSLRQIFCPRKQCYAHQSEILRLLTQPVSRGRRSFIMIVIPLSHTGRP